jgi:hypothetical protein
VLSPVGWAFYGLTSTFLLLALSRSSHCVSNYGRENGQLLGLDRAPEVRTCAPSSKRLAEQEQVFPALNEWMLDASEEAALLRLACVSGHRRKTEARRPLPKLAMSFVNASRRFPNTGLAPSRQEVTSPSQDRVCRKVGRSLN